jgi:hypothetical protein
MEYLGYLSALENMINNPDIPLVSKQISLLGVSNLYMTITENLIRGRSPPRIGSNTREFALNVLKGWEKFENKGENKELIRNLIYSAIVLFYNLIHLRR